MLKAVCHCGSVEIQIADAPTEITECNCSICHRYGVLWAYYHPDAVVVPEGATDTYSWRDRSIDFHRCRTCGCVTHWSPRLRARDRMAVNARLLPHEVLRGVRVRHLDGADTERYVD